MSEQVLLPKTQVIIVGAGPTGLSLAAELLRYGIDFIIIEKNEKTTHLSKAVVVQARTLEIFDELGLGDKAIAEGRMTTAFNVFYKGKHKVALNLSGLGAGLSKYPFALSLEQSKTEKLLVDHLTGKGKNICWNATFNRLEQTADGVKVFYTEAGGQEKIVEGEYLVGCDGAGSPVRHQLGLHFEGDTIARIFYVADVKLSSPVVNKDELFIFLIERGFILYFPMEGAGHYRLIGILPDKKEEDDSFEFSEIEESVREQMQVPVIFEELRWFSTYKVHSRKSGSFMNGRCFIAGDAGHIHTPAGGQGMNTGIQDAYNLAWKLALTIRGTLKASLLESYDTEREENAKHLLNTTDRMFEFMTGANRFWNFIRLNIFPSAARFVSKNAMFNKQIFPLLSQIGIAYPDSTLTVKSNIGKIDAGERMPYFVFKNGKNIFDWLKDPSFKLLFFGSSGSNKFEQIKPAKITIALYSFEEIPEKTFGSETDFYILLRPDNHIS